MGFALAFGILLASLIVSSILVPAITAIVGRRAWWPGPVDREPDPTSTPPVQHPERELELAA